MHPGSGSSVLQRQQGIAAAGGEILVSFYLQQHCQANPKSPGLPVQLHSQAKLCFSPPLHRPEYDRNWKPSWQIERTVSAMQRLWWYTRTTRNPSCSQRVITAQLLRLTVVHHSSIEMLPIQTSNRSNDCMACTFQREERQGGWGEGGEEAPAHCKAIRFPCDRHANNCDVEIQVPHHLLYYLQPSYPCQRVLLCKCRVVLYHLHRKGACCPYDFQKQIRIAMSRYPPP